MENEVLSAVLESAPDGIMMVDDQGLIVLVNRQTEAIFGCARGELLGSSVESLLPERLRRVHTAHRSRYRADPLVRAMGHGMELRGRRRDGTEFPVEISLSPLRSGKRTLTIATVRDVTDRTEAEARARRVQATLDAVQEGVFIFDVDSLRFTHVNRGAVGQTGYSRSELLTMTPLHIAPELSEQRFRDLVAPLVADEEASVTLATVHRRADGTDVPVEIVLQRPFSEPEGPRSFVALARDITERVRTERELRGVRQELALTDDRERIARDLHDTVIQQLFALGMSLQAVAHRVEPPSAAARVQATIDGLDVAIRDLRSAIFGLQSRPEWGGEGLRAGVLRLAVDASRSLGFEPEVSFSGPVDDVDQAVADQLLPALREALSNAARHADARGVEVEVAVSGDGIVLRVADDGRGLLPGLDARLGSGLRNMRSRAQGLGGTLQIREGEQGGAVAEWRVPLRPAAAAEDP